MRNRRISYKSVIVSEAMFGVERMEIRQPSLVDSYYHDTTICPETGAEVVGYHNPLYMLFNQERLNRLGDGAVQQWLKSLDAAGNSSLSDLRSKVKDEDLLKLIRPRQCQSPSELENYLSYLNERADVLNKEVARILAEEKQAQEQQQQQQLQQQQQEQVVETPKSV